MMAAEAELDRLRAENERLRDIAWKHGNRADEAEAENERLRAALTEVMQGARSIDYAINIAREALSAR